MPLHLRAVHQLSAERRGLRGRKELELQPGLYSPNTSIQKPEGLEDKPFEYWQDKLVLEDLDYLYEHYIDVYEFIATRVG